MCDAGKPAHLYCNVLSIEPLVIVGYGSPGPFSPALQLCEPLKKHKAYFLLGSWWDLRDPVELSRTVLNYQTYCQAYPQHHFIYMVNEEVHRKILGDFGVPAVFCHQNAFLDEKIFHIQPLEKSFDAVYNARLEPFKRHHLARRLRSLGLIFYNTSGPDGLKYRDSILRSLPQAAHLNMVQGAYRFLNHDEIGRAHV